MARDHGSLRSLRLRLLALLCVAVAVVFGAVMTADAGVITNWRNPQPRGNVGVNYPIIVNCYSGASPDPLVSSTLKLSIDGVLVPREAMVASVLPTSVYVYYNPVPVLADGVHTFRVEVSDTKGRLSAYSWTANIIQPPSATFSAPTEGATLATGRPSILMALSDNTPGTTFSVLGQVHSGTSTGPIVTTFQGSSASAAQAFSLASELAPGTYYLTATVTDSAGNPYVIQGTSARKFTTAAAPAMSVFNECDSCHGTYRTAHTTSWNCTNCHVGYDGQHMQPSLYCDDCHDQWHTGGNRSSVPISGSCTNCHNSSRPSVPRHTTESVDAKHQGSCGGCHEGSLIAKHATTSTGSAYANQCSMCHASSTPAVVTAIAEQKTDCEACHGQQHGDITAKHTFDTMPASCKGVGCHVNTLADAHAKYVGPGKRYPQYEDACDLCHENTDPERIDMTTATADCSSCHESMHGDVAQKHVSPTNATCFGAGCHDASKDLPTVHASYAGPGTQYGYDTTCDLCHANRDPQRINWSTATAQCTGVCHSGTTHSRYLVRHLPGPSSSGCMDCHGTNLSDIHGAGTDFTKCAMCHEQSGNWSKTADCSSCHEAHPVDSAFCTGCHTVASGTYAGPSTFSATKHASTSASTKALTTYPGTTAEAGECGNCHGVHTTTRTAGNQLCFDCHDGAGTTKPSTYSYQGKTRYEASAHGKSTSAKACGTCHAVHGATSGGTQVASGLQKADPGVCAGSVSQPGCHAQPANSKSGVNILSAFNAGAASSTHHDVFGTGTHIDCSSCHNPHSDETSVPYTNPRSIGTTLPNATDRFIDANGRAYALFGAQHDAIGPVITNQYWYSTSSSTPQTRNTYWYTDENSYAWVEYGPTTSYGSVANANTTYYSTYHYVSNLNFPIGTTSHWRYKMQDALGNVSYGPDNTYRVPWTFNTKAAAISGGTGGTPITVTWDTLGACDSWVDYGPSTAYGSSQGSTALTTTHSVTLNGLQPGLYHLRARSSRDGDTYDSGDIFVTVYGTGIAPVLTPVPSDTNIPGPKEITFNWSQPDVAHAPFTYQLHVWDAYSTASYEYISPWLTTNTTTLTLDGDHTYYWTVQAKDKDGVPYPLPNPPGSFQLYYYNGGSGSCPFLYTWTGEKYAFEADEFAAGKLGLNTKSGFRKPNPFDYHILANEPAPVDGAIEYKLVEERAETDYVDQLKLYTLEAPADKDIYVERTQAEGVGRFTTFDAVMHTTDKNLSPPPSVKWVNTGEDVRSKVAASDGDQLVLNEDRNIGYEYQTIELDLGDVKDAPKTKLVIDGRTCIPTSVAGRQRSLQFGAQVKMEVQNSAGSWVSVPTTNTILPKPPEFTRPFVLDLSRVWISDSRKVRFTFLYKTYFDAILLDTTEDVPVKLTEVPLVSADLQPHGFNDKSSLGELYEYVYGAPVKDPTYYLPGNYTKFGRVDTLLKSVDDKFVIFGGGDELTLRFKQPASPGVGVTRKFMFVSDGYYKDLKQTIDHTVEPLPFHGMSNFPYAESEHYPDDAEHNAYQQEWNTRYQGEGSTIDMTPDETPVSSLLDGAGALVARVVDAVEEVFSADDETVQVASLASAPVDDLYSIDTDVASLKINYSSTSTSVVPAAGWESQSSGVTLPTPSSPGTAVSAATLTQGTSLNNAYWRTDLATTDRSYNWQLVQFNVPMTALNGAKAMQVNWRGHGEPTPGYPVRMYLWDFKAAQWVLATQADGGADFDLSRIERQASTQSFCISCHQLQPPAGSAQAANFADIATAWSKDAHGDRAGNGYGGTLKAPYARQSNAITCEVCHDSHGSANTYHLKSSINGQAVTVTTGDTYDNACTACHAGTVNQWHNECRVCHQEGTDHTWGPDIDASFDCARCHKHGQVWPHPEMGCHGCGDPSGMSWNTF